MRWCVLAVVATACGGLPADSRAVHNQTPTFPLVGPLEHGALLTPVLVSGEGPYLFALDPGAPHTVIDVAVIAQVVDPAGQDSAAVELTIGDLVVGVRDVQFAGTSLDRDGRRINGVIGRDVLADASVFGFDRARGIAWLAPAASYRPPDGATELALEPDAGDGVARVDGVLDGVHRSMIVALGTEHNELHRALWKQTAPLAATIVDDFGNRHTVTDAGAAGEVKVGPVTRADQLFVDPELARSPGDGALGLAYFEPFAVAVNRAARRIYLTPRGQVAAGKRIGRWGELPCPDLGCARIERASTGEIVVIRDRQTAGHDLEITVSAVGSERAPTLVFNLPAGVDRASHELPPELAGSELAVVDLSPFPRTCPGGGCVTATR